MVKPADHRVGDGEIGRGAGALHVLYGFIRRHVKRFLGAVLSYCTLGDIVECFLGLEIAGRDMF